jgi:hypothetical protein
MVVKSYTIYVLCSQVFSTNVQSEGAADGGRTVDWIITLPSQENKKVSKNKMKKL